MSDAASLTKCRQPSISHRMRATSSNTESRAAKGLPKATLFIALCAMVAKARSICPMQRMQWWMRPGPSLRCAISKPLPRCHSTFDLGIRTSVNESSKCPFGASSSPNTVRGRTNSIPSVLARSTNNILCCANALASGSVLPIKIMTLQCKLPAPVHHHFRPFTTKSSPSSRISILIFVASELATSGSVIAKHDRIDPSSNGESHFSFCCSLPNLAMVSIFPVSGDAQLQAVAANSKWTDVPISSHRSAYCRFVRPLPKCVPFGASCALSAGKNKFQRPRCLASCIKSTMRGG
mmetsp:Transcript_12763/g.37201  ORF Transcript_12763/g.37201 Transcript_12763/m.37201 type:complete len:293 (-) Transcript_12763:309-1187(-)